MAGFTRTNGDFQAVAVYDNGTGNAYINAGNVQTVTSNVTIQPQGPALQFFTLTANSGNVLSYISNVVQTVEQLSTVMLYEVNSGANTIAFATYPVAGWDLTNGGSNASYQIDAAVTAALPSSADVTFTVASTATFTN